MPMTFTDQVIRDRVATVNESADRLGVFPIDLTLPIEQLREEFALFIEGKYKDYVEGWEVRMGRPWNTMTHDEAMELVRAHPETKRNLGVVSRLFGG